MAIDQARIKKAAAEVRRYQQIKQQMADFNKKNPTRVGTFEVLDRGEHINQDAIRERDYLARKELDYAKKGIKHYEPGELANELNTEADKFQASIPQRNADLGSIAQANIKAALDQRMKQQQNNLNARGLIQGGIAKQGSNDLHTQAALEYNNQQGQINQESQDILNQERQSALNASLGQYGIAADAANSRYADALASRNASNQAYSGIGQGIGLLGGTIIGSQGSGDLTNQINDSVGPGADVGSGMLPANNSMSGNYGMQNGQLISKLRPSTGLGSINRTA